MALVLTTMAGLVMAVVLLAVIVYLVVTGPVGYPPPENRASLSEASVMHPPRHDGVAARIVFASVLDGVCELDCVAETGEPFMVAVWLPPNAVWARAAEARVREWAASDEVVTVNRRHLKPTDVIELFTGDTLVRVELISFDADLPG